MRKLLLLFLFGCSATMPTAADELYHRFSIKPSIVEQTFGAPKRIILQNPFDVKIKVYVSCDGEEKQRQYTLEPSGSEKDKVAFVINSALDHSCSMENWKVVE